MVSLNRLPIRPLPSARQERPLFISPSPPILLITMILAPMSAKRTQQYLGAALQKTYPQLLKEHVAAYRKFYDRVQLDLGYTDAAKEPTDTRLRRFAAGKDPQLAALYFQYGRYLLIASSQPGGQPANLQEYGTIKWYRPGTVSTPSISTQK